MMRQLYSRRNQRQSEATYSIPFKARLRLFQLLEQSTAMDLIGSSFLPFALKYMLLREYGELAPPTALASQKSDDEVWQHFFSCDDEQALDFLEACFQVDQRSCKTCAPAFVEAINQILRQEATGFQLTPVLTEVIQETVEDEDGEPVVYDATRVTEFPMAVRVDSQHLHQEAIQPTFTLLSDPRYRGADEEYRRAHEHFRHGRYTESLNESLKAFESAMKIICDLKGWRYEQKDTAKTLVKTCLDNALLPTFSQEQLNGLRLLLESAVPTTRNKLSGHGQGTQQVTVPEHIASFALHATAANVLLMVSAAR